VEAAAGGGDGVGGHDGIGRQSVLLPVICEVLGDAVAQFLRGRTEVAASRVRGVVAGARGGGTRMKIFLAGELLAEQARAGDFAFRPADQAAICLVTEEHLSKAEHDEGVKAAANYRQNERSGERRPKV